MTYANLEGIERRYGGPNGYGHKGLLRRVLGFWEHIRGPKRTPIRHLFDRLGATPSSPRDLRPAVLDARGAGIFDQANTSSCTGHAEVGALMTRLVLAGTPAPYRLSPFDAYRKGRRIDVGPTQPLVDDGAIPEQVTRACAEWGICSYDSLPDDPSRVNEEPMLGELEQGLRAVVRGIYGISGSDVESQVQAAVSAGYPVKLGALIDDTFEAWSGGAPCGPPDPSRILGGHAIYVCGWSTWSGGNEYVLANSWGTAGESGFWRVSSAWLQQASDLEVVDVTALEVA